MPGLSSWAVRRPVIALIAWGIAMVAVFGLSFAFKGSLNDSFDLPATESKTATDLLSSSGTDTSRLDGGATIVWSATNGTAIDAGTAGKVQPLLQEIADMGSVACVTNPFDPRGASLGTNCPKPALDPAAMAALSPEELQTLAGAFSTVSPDGKVAYASVTFGGDGTEVDVNDAKAIIAGVKALNGSDLRIGAQGQVLEFAGQEPPSSEGIGIIVAIVILLIAFGSLIAEIGRAHV